MIIRKVSVNIPMPEVDSSNTSNSTRSQLRSQIILLEAKCAHLEAKLKCATDEISTLAGCLKNMKSKNSELKESLHASHKVNRMLIKATSTEQNEENSQPHKIIKVKISKSKD